MAPSATSRSWRGPGAPRLLPDAIVVVWRRAECAQLCAEIVMPSAPPSALQRRARARRARRTTSAIRSMSASVVRQFDDRGPERDAALVARRADVDAAVGEQCLADARVEVVELALETPAGRNRKQTMLSGRPRAARGRAARRPARPAAAPARDAARPSRGSPSARRRAASPRPRASARAATTRASGTSSPGRYGAVSAKVERSGAGSRTKAKPQSYGTFSHLCPSAMTEWARSTPAASAGRRGVTRAKSPKAPSTCSHAPIALGEVGHPLDRIEVAGVHLARVADHDRGRAVEPGSALLERLDVEPPAASRASTRTVPRPMPSIASAFVALGWM